MTDDQMINMLNNSKNFAVAFLLASFLTIATLLGSSLLQLNGTEVSFVEIVAVFTTYGCTYLCTVQSRQNYYWGFISVIFYAILFYSSDPPLLASAAVQLYLIGALVYGWWRWGPDDNSRPVTFTPIMMYPVYIIVTAAVWYGAVLITSYFGGAMSFMDSAILALTILAQLALDNKRIESWAVWAVVNVVAIPLYFSQGLYLVGFQYIFLLGNTLWGAYKWRKSMQEEAKFKEMYS